MNLPIVIEGLGSPITIRQDDLTAQNVVGYFDEPTGDIVLDAGLDEFGQHAVLIHELLHLTASALKQAGVIKRQPDEAFIANAASQLLIYMGKAGLLKALSPEQIDAVIGGDDA